MDPIPSNYYDFFGLEHRLHLDLKDLEKRFYALSRQYHPDRYTLKSRAEQQVALDATAVLNDAYRTLRDPLARAEYLLKENGFDIGEQGSKNVPPELLDEVFELNMQLEELKMNQKMGEDDASLTADIAKHKVVLEAKHDKLLEELQSYWKEWDALVDRNLPAGSADGKQITSKMVDVLNRRNYIRNLLRDVNAALEN